MNENKFTGRADIYAKYRPTYPDVFIEYLYSKAGFQRLGETITNDGPALLMAMDRLENDRQ